MGNEETLSKQEIIHLIEEGDRYAGVQFEEIKDDFNMLAEIYETLDVKIDKVDAKVENLRKEMTYSFGQVFEELHNMRKDFKEFSERFDRLEQKISP